MPVTFACADLGSNCPAMFTTWDMEELFEHLALHTRVAHEGMEITPQVLLAVQSVVRWG